MSIKRSSTQRTNNSTRYGTNNSPINVQNQTAKFLKNSDKQLAKKFSDPAVEATKSALKSSSNGLTHNPNIALKVRDSSKQPIESVAKEKKKEIVVAGSSARRVSQQFQRGKSWIESKVEKVFTEQLSRPKSEELKGFKRCTPLSNKTNVLKTNRESKKLKKQNPKKRQLTVTDDMNKEDIKNQKLSPPDITTTSAGCKPKQKLLCQERSDSVESTATQTLNTELQSPKDQLIPETMALRDKSYTVKPQLVLYYNILSPQARSCLMLMNFLKLDLELRCSDQLTCQQLSEDFQKINAWHTIPKLVHNDLALTDSHTILMYLCVTFASPQTQQLFPTCPLTRLKIMNMFFFEVQVLFRRYSNYMTDIVRKEFANIDFDFHRNKIFESYELLNGFLKNSQFLVGNTLTLADISMVATFSALDLMFPIDLYQELWPQLANWFHFMRGMPMYLPNYTGVKKQKNIIRSFNKCILPN